MALHMGINTPSSTGARGRHRLLRGQEWVTVSLMTYTFASPLEEKLDFVLTYFPCSHSGEKFKETHAIECACRRGLGWK
jgi:hypothetical protein